MFAELLLAYLELGRSGTGLTVLGLISLLCCGAVVFWAYRDPDIQRRAVLIAAGVLTAVVTLIYGLAVLTGEWAGAYFRAPLVAQAALLLPLSLLGWLVWLRGYGWLTTHSRHPLLVYIVGALLLIPVAILADQAEVTGGLVLVANNGNVWMTAIIVVAVSLLPILLFELTRRLLSRDLLP